MPRLDDFQLHLTDHIEDDMVETCLYYFTDLPVDEVRRLGGMRDASINESKTILAFEITKLIHGEDDALKARDQAKSLFGGGGGSDAPVVVLVMHRLWC